METKIILNTIIDTDVYYNIGIDFGPQCIVGTNKRTNKDIILIRLSKGIRLDNRYIKDYKIVCLNNETIIEILC
jgi:hypothetical protein